MLCHYVNMPMHFNMVFKTVKRGSFLMKNGDVLLIFAQNINCGYSFNNLCLRAKIREIMYMFLYTQVLLYILK